MKLSNRALTLYNKSEQLLRLLQSAKYTISEWMITDDFTQQLERVDCIAAILYRYVKTVLHSRQISFSFNSQRQTSDTTGGLAVCNVSYWTSGPVSTGMNDHGWVNHLGQPSPAIHQLLAAMSANESRGVNGHTTICYVCGPTEYWVPQSTEDQYCPVSQHGQGRTLL